jgi:hypothetical protein
MDGEIQLHNSSTSSLSVEVRGIDLQYPLLGNSFGVILGGTLSLRCDLLIRATLQRDKYSHSSCITLKGRHKSEVIKVYRVHDIAFAPYDTPPIRRFDTPLDRVNDIRVEIEFDAATDGVPWGKAAPTEAYILPIVECD